MLKGIHFLLTYCCTYECDHCFLYSSPHATGTFNLSQVKAILREACKIGTISRIFFEGGEAFLFYPLLMEGVKAARESGFEVGIVSNSYWAISPEDAELWLKPLMACGLTDISLSEDAFHSGEVDDEKPRNALAAAQKLGLEAGTICIQAPKLDEKSTGEKGEPVIGGSTMFKGRAAEKLVAGLPTRPGKTFTECEHEDFVLPGRVHVDVFGNVQICQGLSIGNMWETPLAELINSYDPETHPIFGPMIRGGPFQLAREYGIELDGEFVDECHFCFNVRRKLLPRFPQYLAPEQVYGL